MSKLIIIIFLSFSFLQTNAQGFWKFYGQGRLNDCIITSDTSILAVGNGFFVMKTDLQGDTIWTRYYAGTGGMSGVNEAYSVVETPDHYFLVCGYSGNLTSSNLRLIKIDRNGNLIWNKYYGTATGEATCVKVNHRGLYVIARLRDLSGSDGIMVFETDTSGNLIWQSTVRINNGSETNRGLDLDSHDNVYITGASSLLGNPSGSIIKIDSSGNPLDTFQISCPNGSILHDIVSINDSEFYVCGNIYSTSNNEIGWLIKMNSHGDTIQTWQLPYYITCWRIKHITSQHLIILDGLGYDSAQTNPHVFISWFDDFMNPLGIKKIDTTYDESFGFDFYNNKIYVAGYSDFPSQFEYQWIYMFENISTGIISPSKNLISTYFSDNKLYFLWNDIQGKCLLYDILGREKKSIAIDEFSGIIDLSDLPPSSYVAVFINNKKEIESAIKIVLTIKN